MQWSVQNEQEAQSMLPENNIREGRYSGIVSRQEIISGKIRDDGSKGDDWLRLNVMFDTPVGKIYGDASIFNSARMFFKRKHFWESAGQPEKVNAQPEDYLNQHVVADCKVETYTSKTGELKKKLVVIDFVGESSKSIQEDKFID